MNMKRVFFAMVLAAVSFGAAAQQTDRFGHGEDSLNCIKYLSYYQEYYKQSNYVEALPNWRKALQHCPPTASENMLLNGQTMLRREVNKRKTREEKLAVIDSIMMLYKLRVTNFSSPATKVVNALNVKGQDLTNYARIIQDDGFLFGEYDAIIKNNEAKTLPMVLMFDFQCATKLYKEGKMDADSLIGLYMRNSDLADKARELKPAQASMLEDVKAKLNRLLRESEAATCEKIISIYGPRVEENPGDVELLKLVGGMMQAADECLDNDLFLKVAESLYHAEPSYTSAYSLFQLYNARDDYAKASKFLEEAIAFPESDDATDADYTFKLATIAYKNRDIQKAYECAQTAMKLDGQFSGRSNFLLGQIWSNLSCGGNEISRRAKYWVATDFMQKAKAADPELAEEANNMIAQFSRYYPETSEAFMYDLRNGQGYTVSCGGFTASTTVRTISR